MSNLTVFNFQSHEVRFVGTAEIPEWVAADIIAVLYPNAAPSSYNKYLSKVPAHKKGKKKILTPGGEQEVATVFEGGFYRLVMRSNSPNASPFQDWVEDEVLPTIRKTGKYELAQAPSPSPQLPTPSLEQISDLIDLTLGKAGIEPKLLAGVKLNAITKEYPSLASAAEEAKSLLVVPIESPLLTPKRIGEIVGERTGEKWSSQRVNKKLIEKELQVVNPDDGDPDYLATEQGKQYSDLTYGTAKGRNKTVQHLRWYESVVEVLLEEINALQ